MANTTNLNMVKPAGTDHALISVINSNMDIIDGAVGALPSGTTLQGEIDSANQAIGTVSGKVNVATVTTVPYSTGVYYCTASQTIGGVTIPAYCIYDCHVYGNDGSGTVIKVGSGEEWAIGGLGGSWGICKQLALKINAYTTSASTHTYQSRAVQFSKCGGCVSVRFDGLVSLDGNAVTKICDMPSGYDPQSTFVTDIWLSGTKVRFTVDSSQITTYVYSSSGYSDSNTNLVLTYSSQV